VDAQAGVEAAVQVLASALSGPSLVHDVGFLDCADIGSLSYLVLVDEIIGMTARFMRGVQVSRETIMMDLIEKVGPGGTFINQPESVSLCRREAWVPSVFDRNSYHLWSSSGSPTVEDIISKKVHKILNSHRPALLPSGVDTKLSEILMKAEARERASVT
jgi:trimethylamine--corrinoid protein Co-methyltransferase